ncbi:MAG: SOS response-associated peptidase family protein [Planctomycetota bacterium]
MGQYWDWSQLRSLLDGAPGIEADLLDRLLDSAPPSPGEYNLSPGQRVMTIVSRGTGLEADCVEWGVPLVRPDGAIRIVGNARSETVDRLPMFRDAFQYARCLVPSSGFYEWGVRAAGDKQPWYFRAEHHPLFFLAGLIVGVGRDRSLAVITAATPETAHTRVHHRSPCVIHPEHAASWLGLPDHGAIGPRSCLRTFGSDHAFEFTGHPVSRRVNRATNNDAELTRPVEPDRTLFG